MYNHKIWDNQQQGHFFQIRHTKSKDVLSKRGSKYNDKLNVGGQHRFSSALICAQSISNGNNRINGNFASAFLVQGPGWQLVKISIQKHEHGLPVMCSAIINRDYNLSGIEHNQCNKVAHQDHCKNGKQNKINPESTMVATMRQTSRPKPLTLQATMGQMLWQKIRTILLHLWLLHPSPFPSPLVANPKPAEDIIPVITWKPNNNPYRDTSWRISCSSGAIVTLWMV